MSAVALRRSVPVVAALALLAAAAPLARAQRPDAKVEWQKHAVWLNYGVPRVGKHNLDELAPGSTWRLGAGPATTLTAETAVITDQGVIAPGNYRVNLARPATDQFSLTIEGAGTWARADAPDVSAKASAFEQAKKPNEKLEIAVAPAKEQPDAELRAVAFQIQYGAPVVTVPMTVVGVQTLAAKGFAVDAFKIPADLLQKRLDAGDVTPVASLVRKGKPKEGEAARLNLMLGENKVVLLPAAVAPTGNSSAFAQIPGPDKAVIWNGKVQWSDAAAPAAHLAVESATIDDDGTLHLVVLAGARKAAVTIATTAPKN
jgi:hypothetical protein